MNFKTILPLTLAGAALLVGCGTGETPTKPDSKPIASASQAWVRADKPEMTAAYMTIQTSQAESLTGAKVDPTIAEKTTLHQTVTDGKGMTEMKPVKEIPLARGVTQLKPGDYHIMLEGLKKPIQEGQEIKIVLTTSASGEIIAEASGKTEASGMENHMN